VAKEPWQAESEFVFPSPFVPIHAELREYALVSFTPDRPVLEASIDLMHRIHADFKYQSNATDVSTPLIEAFEERRGVCQDFAHILIGCVRSLGLAARYVSGYLLTNPPPGKPRLLGADASHAWVSVFCPHVTNNGGWVQLDPTNNVIPSTAHVTLAFGRDYGDVAPLRGVIRGGGEHKLAVAVSVIPVDEEPALILAAQRDAELAAKKAGGLDDANVVLAVQSTQSQAQTGSGQASPVLAPKLLDQG
jgi:transglutaminase-like putative cysteine protease